MNSDYDVLVVGGGIVGLTAALAMAKHRHKVALFDAGDLKVNTSTMDLRVYAINKASQALFNELDVWQQMDANRLSPYEKMHVWDAATGAYIDFDSRSIAEPYLGNIIEESIIKEALLLQISKTENIHLFSNTVIEKVDEMEKGITVCTKDCSWTGQLLMIADGANSPIREKLGVPITSWSYQQNALIAQIRTERPHERTASQVFHTDGPLAFLPLADPHQCSIVWSTTPQRAEHLLTLKPDAFNHALSTAFANRLGTVEVISDRHQFPLRMRHVQQYVGTRWILLGDAAHTIHPLAGLGLNVGLADVRSWMNFISATKNSLYSSRSLQAYQRERKYEVWKIILLMDGFKRLFGIASPPISVLRTMGMRFCNEFSPIKRLFIQHASGPI